MTSNPYFEWLGDRLRVVDQTRLPLEITMVDLISVAEVIDAIKVLMVRGAPAIGAAGGYAVVLGLRAAEARDASEALENLNEIANRVSAARPTAVALTVAVEQVQAAAAHGRSPAEIIERAEEAANEFVRTDHAACEAIARVGSELLSNATRFLTHCNAGRVATTANGTALGILYALHDGGTPIEVFASESRPLLQGGRLTSWELRNAGINVKVIPDGAGASLLASESIDAVVVGADRIAMNGDTANKIGTLAHAVSAARFGVPFHVAAPMSTIDPTAASGDDIEIEMRDPDELFSVGGVAVADAQGDGWNPAFDVTPGDLITAIITDRGIAKPPFETSLKRFVQQEQEGVARA